MSYPKRLYLIVHPNTALVASQLDPQAFAQHYQIGSTRFFTGRLVFAEVAPDFRNDFFDIQRGLDALVPHEDGRPKATKFVGSYRTLEHMDFGALYNLYIATPDGEVLELYSTPYDKQHAAGHIRTFAEIAPLTPLVLSNWDMPEFAQYMTRPENPKGAPKIFFTQVELDVEEFLEAFERNPFMPAPLPTLHPSKLRDAILDLKANRDKGTKGVALSSDFEHISLRRIRHGLMFASQDDTKFYPMPSAAEIEKRNYRFYRSMDF